MSSRLLLTLLFFLLSMPCEAAETRVPARIESIGDDGLTQRFVGALREAIARSPHFTDAAQGPYEIKLLVAGHLYWRPTPEGINFQAVVIYTDQNEQFLGVSTDACWERDMQRCAAAIAQEAFSALNAAPNKSFKPNPLRGSA